MVVATFAVEKNRFPPLPVVSPSIVGEHGVLFCFLMGPLFKFNNDNMTYFLLSWGMEMITKGKADEYGKFNSQGPFTPCIDSLSNGYVKIFS